MKSKEIALKAFARNKGLNEVHITSDKTVFHTEHQADSHAQRLKDRKVSSHKREDIYTEDVIAKNAAAQKDLELKAQKKAEAQAKAQAKFDAATQTSKEIKPAEAQAKADAEAQKAKEESEAQAQAEAAKELEVKDAKQVASSETKSKSNTKKTK